MASDGISGGGAGVLKLDGKVVATQKQLENADKSAVSRKSGSVYASESPWTKGNSTKGITNERHYK
jgi:hypothetical protein